MGASVAGTQAMAAQRGLCVLPTSRRGAPYCVLSCDAGLMPGCSVSRALCGLLLGTEEKGEKETGTCLGQSLRKGPLSRPSRWSPSSPADWTQAMSIARPARVSTSTFNPQLPSGRAGWPVSHANAVAFDFLEAHRAQLDVGDSHPHHRYDFIMASTKLPWAIPSLHRFSTPDLYNRASQRLLIRMMGMKLTRN